MNGLLGTKGFNTRFECGVSWSDGLILTHMIADVVTALCFLALPVIFIWCTRKRPDIPFTKEVILFSIGTVLCSLTHFSAAIIPYWWPAYRFDAAVKSANALAWTFIVYAIALTIPRVLRMLTPLRIVRMQSELIRTPLASYSVLVDHLAERKVVIDETLKKDFEVLQAAVDGLKKLERRVEEDLK